MQRFEEVLPRQLEIIYESNRRFLGDVRRQFPGDEGRVQRVSLVEEGSGKKIRMANLAVIGSHSTNGVAAIHSDLLRHTTLKDLAEIFPERFNNKTNGVTPRRWLCLCNPELSSLITDAIGDGWICDLSQLTKLTRFSGDSGFRDDFRKAKRKDAYEVVCSARCPVLTVRDTFPDPYFKRLLAMEPVAHRSVKRRK